MIFKRFRLFFIFYFFSFAFGQACLYSDVSDVVVVLDTSGSLLSYYNDVTGKVLDELLTNYVRKKDVFHLISFDASVHLEISRVMSSDEDFSDIVSKFFTSYPLAKSSDILLALDFLQNYLSSLSPLHDKKVIFVSDGLFTTCNKYSNYTKEDLEKKLNDFSNYLSKMEKIQTYYVKLPITSNQIVVELNNDFSDFLASSFEMTEILAYPLIFNLPISLEEYLRFDDLGGSIFRGKNVQSFERSNVLPVLIEDENVVDDEVVESIDLNRVGEIVMPPTFESNDVEMVKESFRLEEKLRNIEDGKKDFEDFDTENTVEHLLLDGENTEDHSAISNVDNSETRIFEKKLKGKNSILLYMSYILLSIAFLFFLIIFFLIKKYLKEYRDREKTFEEEDVLSPEPDTELLVFDNDVTSKAENVERKNEVLFSSVEEYFDTTEDNLRNVDFKTNEELSVAEVKKKLTVFAMSEKKDTKIVENISKEKCLTSKTLPKEEKILLNVKTMENNLTTEYSPTFFTLSPDTKKLFAGSSAIESMAGLLNASYIDSNDMFYRFKRSLYAKKYVKNIDKTKQNYIEMFVLNQSRSIGARNTHYLVLNKTFYLGGGKHDDFLIFLVPIPRRLASIHYDETEIIFTILEPKYFPYEKEIKIKNPIDRFFVINSDKGYTIHFMLRIYEKETITKYSNTVIFF